MKFVGLTMFVTRNSSIDEKGERYAIVVKLCHPYILFPRNVRLSHRRIATFSARHDFLIIVPYKYSYSDSAGPACPDCYWSAQLRRQWTTNMEQSASRSSNTRYDSVLFQASSQGPPVSAVVYAAADWWLSTVHPAPL